MLDGSAATKSGLTSREASTLVACVVTLAAIGLLLVLLKLASVLVPLCFAIFLAFLLEPVLAGLVLAPLRLASVWRRCCRGYARCCDRTEPPAPATSPRRAALPASQLLLPTSISSGTLVESGAVSLETMAEAGCTRCRSRCFRGLVMFWDAVSCLLTVGLLIAVVGFVVILASQALQHFDWEQYMHSPKVSKLKEFMHRALGIDIEPLGIIKYLDKDQMLSVLFSVVNFVNSCILTLLLFFFCLVGLLPGIHDGRRRSKVQRLMQRYLLFKAISTLIVTLAVMVGLWVLQVDLLIIWGICTFALNFIPNIGAFLAIMLPVPLVFLEPESTFQDLFMVVLVPFLIHNSLGCIIEPQLMAEGLELHPLIVVVALTFWGAVWGIAGALLSVPITCALKIVLEEIQHPAARRLLSLFDAPMGFSHEAAREPSRAEAAASS
mmetsp:Transcript_45433/g.83102  ORF Transcript_45433/g.83102 Transcript_45433/m.83102 type:complete len:437 (-) Transcript_45433:51-1361(-)